VIAGENSLVVERQAEELPFEIRVLNTGSLKGRASLEDGVADMACVSGGLEPSADVVVAKGFTRELGLISREETDLKDAEVGSARVVGWHRDSEMKRLFESLLKSEGIATSRYARTARTHSGVAASIAAGLADLGFGEREAAAQAGLCFQPLVEDEVSFLVKSSVLECPAARSFLESLSQSSFWRA
jgi:molybdate-binding protein